MNSPQDTVAALPHAVGPEKSVVSTLLRDPQFMDEVPGLTPDHFYLLTTRTVFSLIQELTVAGKPVELVSFIQTLLDRGLLERIGGQSALADLFTYSCTESHLQVHAEILNDKLARRLTIAAAAEMTRVAYEDADPQEMIEATSAPITTIHDILTGTRPARSTKNVLQASLAHFQELCTGRASPMGIETSLVEINRRFRGLHAKQTVVISGYPGGGKTTLAGQLAIDAALDAHNTLVCSVELPAEKFMERLLAYVARLPGDAVTDPLRYAKEVLGKDGLPQYDLDAIKSAALKIAAAPFAIEDLIGATVYQIASCIRRAHRKCPLKVAVVDFVQRIRSAPEMRRESKEQQVAHTSNYLADLAKELGYCMLLPSQLNKTGEAKHAEAINEDSDLHLQISQDRLPHKDGTPATMDHIGVAVMKDRHHGQDGALLPIVLDGPNIRFIPKPFQTK